MRTRHRSTCGCFRLVVSLALALSAGCGTLKSQSATEQLLMSDAVDRAVARLDFRALAGRRVFLDTQYIKSVKGPGFVNADYITSSLRQQLMAATCLLQEKETDADVIVEARVGVLGTDAHEVTYGIPASSAITNAATLVPNAPVLPAIPEISVARKSDQRGAAKIAVFAYERETKRPLWQSGISMARSTGTDTWLIGAGPFQRGTIYDKTQFAGSELHIPLITPSEEEEIEGIVDYNQEHYFSNRRARASDPNVEVVNFRDDPAGGDSGRAETRDVKSDRAEVEPPPAEPPKRLSDEAAAESQSMPPPHPSDG